jgi:hypothetical protein
MRIRSYFYDVSVGTEPDLFRASGVITSEEPSITPEVLLKMKEEIALHVGIKLAEQNRLVKRQQLTPADLNVISLTQMV